MSMTCCRSSLNTLALYLAACSSSIACHEYTCHDTATCALLDTDAGAHIAPSTSAPQTSEALTSITPTTELQPSDISSSESSSSAAPQSAPTTEPSPTGPNEDCNADCCRDSDCNEGYECRDSSCQCKSGQKECDGSCIPATQCCVDEDCGASAVCVDGSCECSSETHLCEGICSSNESPQTCGAGCEPCPVPVGGYSTCDGTKCAAACPSGNQLCAGTCIPNSDSCDANCTTGERECSGVCVSLNSPIACGATCEPCPVPVHSIPTCDGSRCDFDCEEGYLRCADDTCAPATGCCGHDDCDVDQICADSVCACADGTRECDGACVPNSGCCIDADCGSGLGCRDHVCTDVLPPQVIAITPNNDAKGVLSNAAIRLTFNEPMDQASVQSAVSISTISSSGFAMSWNGVGTQLTITPANALVYAAVSNLSGSAQTYTVSVAASASDLEGNRMTSAFSSTFTTLRRVSQTLAPTKVAFGSTYGWGVDDSPPVECPTASGNVTVGNHSSMAGGGDYITWVAFDLSAVGQTSQISTFESAKLLGTQGAQQGNFYPDGNVILDRCTYGAMSQAFELPVSVNHGVFATSAASAVSKDITSGFWTSWTNGEAQRLYRLEPNEHEPSNARTSFTCDGFALELVFLAP